MIPSHVAFVSNIANLLARHGHTVIVIDNVIRNDIANNIDLDIIKHVIKVSTSPKVVDLLTDQSVPLKFWSMQNEPEEQEKVMTNLGKLFLEQCKHLVQNTNVLNELKSVEFDFGIHEVFDVCGIGIFNKLGIRKSVILSSTGMRDIVNEALGISGPLQESSILSDYGSYVSVLETRRNLKFHSAWRRFFEIQSNALEEIMNTTHSFERLLRQSNLMFVNTFELTDTYRPWSRRVHEIGGISFTSPKPLDKEYVSLFDNFTAAVLISFGTTTPSFLMPEKYKKSLIEVLRNFPKVLFLWKYEIVDDFVKNNTVENVVFKKFVPQVDLLESGKFKLFLTHGGQNSLLEAFHSKTRTLIIPIFGDQSRNAQIALENGLSHVLKKEQMANHELLQTAIKRGMESDKKLDANLQRVFLNLQNAKERSETFLISAIESTYTKNPAPPNFEAFPTLYSSDTIILLIDTTIFLISTSLVLFLMKKLFS